MIPARALGPTLLTAALACGMLVVLDTPAVSADPAGQALVRLDSDADGALTVRRDAPGDVSFVGVPAKTDVDNPAVKPSMSAAAAAGAHLARYGAALGTTQPGTTLARTDVQQTAAGDVVRYQQDVDGVPVLGGQVVVSLGVDREVSSILAETSEETTVQGATVTEAAAEVRARAAFVKTAGAGSGVTVQSQGRWVLDAGLIGGDADAQARTVWRFEITRGADERRLLMVDDRTGGILMNIDEIQHAVDRVVCDDNNVRQSSDIPCTSGFAQIEGGPASAVDDVTSAFQLSGAVSDFYQQVADIDITDLLGVSVGGVKKLASTVRWCYTGSSNACPYNNAFWNGSQMYYGTGYAGADDVVGHEITHGFTERNSGLFYWGQSGAMNESISDIIGEIIDHRHSSSGDSPTNWAIGEDVPDFAPDGLRNMQDPTLLNAPDKTSSSLYVQDGYTYPDNDGVHDNSGVGNKTFYLISQGGSFNGQTITGIDAGDAALTKSAKLWLLVDQTLTSGSDYADEAAVLDQSCQALLAGGTADFTAADCVEVHKATLATELRQTPTNNPQPADAEATCPTGSKRVLFDSETGDAASKFVSSSWTRDPVLAHSGADSWSVGDPTSSAPLPLTMKDGITLPSGQASYLHFQQWRALEWEPPAHFYDVGTVEVDDLGDVAPGVDTEGLPWINGPTDPIDKNFGNLATAAAGFGGDSRGFLASRADLSSYAGKTVKPRFVLYADDSTGLVGWALDDITVYTCDLLVVNSTLPTISGTPRVALPLTASPGTWTPSAEVAFGFQWLRNGAPIAGATSATYTPSAIDVGTALAVRVTGTRAGYVPSTVVSAPTTAVAIGMLVKGKPSLKGKARVGSTLAAKGGAWSPAPVTLKYQWLRNGKPIKKATKSKYKLVARDKGKKTSVRVTGTKSGYQTTTATSKATGKVKAKPKKKRR